MSSQSPRRQAIPKSVNFIASRTSTRSRPSTEEAPPAALFPIVGIGASAGGLEAFTQLLKKLPADTGMSFVLIQHLSPEHESALTEILSHATAMPVTEIANGTTVDPNRVYIIPPNTDLALDNGVLRLKPRSDSRAPPHPIDHFLQSLAKDRGDRSVGVILSGTANDGTLGLQCIKEAGGITFAQDGSAQYEGMPRSAVASGAVDLVLSPANISDELARLSRTPFLRHSEPVRPKTVTEQPPEAGPNSFEEVLTLLRNNAKVDFSCYKPSAIERRVTRRMVLNQRNTLEDYLHFIHENPAELQSLYQDLLINLTSFFRDPGAFEALKQKVFPTLLERRPIDDPIRIWVVGCSTGQEVYSIVMSYLEAAGDRNISFKVFGTDIDDAALDQARAGIYSQSLVQEISPQRLRRFFVEAHGGYQITKAIREACVFARHNVVCDPPFSRMDLISCRNLLIYFKPEAQKKVLPMFHYALKPEGFLILGPSESIGAHGGLFAEQDKPHRLYSRKSGPGRSQFAFPADQRQSKTKIQLSNHPELSLPKLEQQREADRILLTRYAPPGVLVGEDLEILQFRGETDPYLKPAAGKPSHSLLKMAHPGLLPPLRELIEQSKRGNAAASREGVRVEQGDGFVLVKLEVVPVRNLPAGNRSFLVLFHAAKDSGQPSAKERPALNVPPPMPDEAARLTHELTEMKDYLQSVLERHDAATEELQAAGEEMQSSNEELQSINEQLETSKEELQATNEELIMVNEALSVRNRENAQLNDDLTNFLNSVSISIVMVGRDFRVRRFTPAAEKLLKITPNDIGRVLNEIPLEIEIPDLESMMAKTIDTPSFTEQELQDRRGRWYLLRNQPYVTLDRKIDGAMITFIDVDDLKRSVLEIKEARDYAESVLRTAPNPLLVLNADLRVETANRAFYETFKNDPAESEGRLIYELGNGQWDIPQLRELLGKVLPENRLFNDFEVTHDFENIGRCTMLLNARMLDDPNGQPSRIVLGIKDISKRKQTEEALRVAQQQLADRADKLESAVAERTKRLTAANEEMEQFSYTITHDMRAPLRAMRGYGEILLTKDESLDPESKAFLHRISSSAERMDQLILDALNYSKLVRQETEMAPVDCGGLIRGMIESYPQFKESHATISIEGELPVVLGNEAALTQCFSNLLNNTIKFVKPGKTPEVRIWAEDKGEFVRVWIEDKGIGIAKDHLERIFVMFQRLNPDYEGTGIGLALVRKATERMGGKAGVESEPGEGSRFWLEFKKAPAQ